MIEKTDETNQSDYSCEIASFFVLVALSALSHFWFIVIAICAALIFAGAMFLLVRFLRSATGNISWPVRARQEFAPDGDSGSQVFQHAKIRQSVDCSIGNR